MDGLEFDEEAKRMLKLTDRALDSMSAILRSKIIFTVPATVAFVVFLSTHHFDSPHFVVRIILFLISIGMVFYTAYLGYFLNFVEISRFTLIQIEFGEEWATGLNKANETVNRLRSLVTVEKISWPLFNLSLISLLLSIVFKIYF